MSDYESTTEPDLPLFRGSDPSTSRASARAITPRLTSKRELMLLVIAEMSGSGKDPTANEAGERCRLLHGGIAETYRKRTKELVDTGQVVVSGERSCVVTGFAAKTLRPSK